MKISKLVILIVMIALALFLMLPNLSWAADDGATIYKTKCAMCHGADLAGKPAAKIPSLIGEDGLQVDNTRSRVVTIANRAEDLETGIALFKEAAKVRFQPFIQAG